MYIKNNYKIQGGIKMKLAITAVTKEVAQFTEEDLEVLKTFSGKNAGLCYMKEGYFDSNVTDPEKARNRFNSTAAIGHHSIADHAKITVVFEDISKMLAMILNSLQDYCTSEKSGRYTKMVGNTEIEQELYDKWAEILVKRLYEITPDVNVAMAEKLAQENARYFLSVFTKSTSMSYTTSLRQWNYIAGWFLDLAITMNDRRKAGECLSYFETELDKELCEVVKQLKSMNLVDLSLSDLKARNIPFLGYQNDPTLSLWDMTQSTYGNVYETSYLGTFVQLAQAQRHRTLKYKMIFDGVSKAFYIPPMIQGTPLADMWIEDMATVAWLIPQGTLIHITESGHTEDFFLKCKERLCGRAQLEIMQQTKETLNKLYTYGKFSPAIKKEITKYMNIDHTANAKCKLVGGCKETCMHGAVNALTRKY